MSEKKAHGIEPELVRELAAILRETDLSEIEVEHGELKLRVARNVTIAASAQPVATVHLPAAAPAPHASDAPREAVSHAGAVQSPMVGTAFLSSEPGAPAFIKIGDTVTEGQTLMIVEAMKTFNPIPAPRAGKVTQILVDDGQPVEFGEALLVLE
jgi:acetyl-CoA carboxylase biotin carboxyl carrier protein